MPRAEAQPLEVIYAGEIPHGMDVVCGYGCGAKAHVSVTVITRKPTAAGELFGKKLSQQFVYGPPNWEGGSTECMHIIAQWNSG
jgi:hypothetical protein